MKSLGKTYPKMPIIFEDNLYWENFDVDIIDNSIIVSIINIRKIRNESIINIVDLTVSFGLIVKAPETKIEKKV
jgi:repressor of nif and glnA expression